MAERQRSWEMKSHCHRYRRPPHPPPAHGYDQCSIPLWERKFCSYVGGISWQKFCVNKKFISPSQNIDQWDDSAAFENFQNTKARFWAKYHGVPSDIPLPDPTMYIDKVNHYCKIDPELVADLERVPPPFEVDNFMQNGINSSVCTNKITLAAELGDAKEDEKCNQNKSTNWDIYVEKPAKVNKWEDNSRSNSDWGMKRESCNAWSTNCIGWGQALVQSNWGSSSSNPYLPNNGNTYQDPSNRCGKKRNCGGYYQQRNRKQKYQAERCQRKSNWLDRRGRNGWQDQRGRNRDERHPFYNRAY